MYFLPVLQSRYLKSRWIQLLNNRPCTISSQQQEQVLEYSYWRWRIYSNQPTDQSNERKNSHMYRLINNTYTPTLWYWHSSQHCVSLGWYPKGDDQGAWPSQNGQTTPWGQREMWLACSRHTQESSELIDQHGKWRLWYFQRLSGENNTRPQ